MKKLKKTLLTIMTLAGVFAIPASIVLTSCYNNNNSNNSSGPTGPIQPEKPEPTPPDSLEPTPPINPEPIPPLQPEPSPTPPIIDPANPITDNSITILNKQSTLPSQLVNLSNNEIYSHMLTKNFDSTKITNISYKLLSLSDKLGSISFSMTGTFQNKQYTHNFHFNGLLKINSESIYLYAKQNDNVLNHINAYQLANYNINTNSNAIAFLNQLNTDKIMQISLISDSYDIPLSYLTTSGISIKNYNNTFFTNGNQIELTIELKSPTILYYEFNNTNLKLQPNYINFPTNKVKSFTLKCLSAADLLLNKIEANDNYVDNKYMDYYWGEQKYNNSANLYVMISSNNWLKDYNYNIEGKPSNIQYQPVLLNNENALTQFSKDGTFYLSLRMKIFDNYTTNFSSSIKTIKISSSKKYPSNLFATSSTEDASKFRFEQKAEGLVKNLNQLKSKKQAILNDIGDNTTRLVQITSIEQATINFLSTAWKSNMAPYFNKAMLINNSNFYSNDFIYVEAIHYTNFSLWYNGANNNDVFQIQFTPIVQMSHSYQPLEPLTVNITQSGNSLNNLKTKN